MTIKLSGSFGGFTGAMSVGDYVSPITPVPVTSGLHAHWDASISDSLTTIGNGVTRWEAVNNPSIYASRSDSSVGGTIISENGRSSIDTTGGSFGIIDGTGTSFTAMTVVLVCKTNSSYPWRIGGTGGGTGTFIGIEQHSAAAGNLGNNGFDLYAGNGNDRRGTLTGSSTYNTLHKYIFTFSSNIHNTVMYDNNVAASMSNQGSNIGLNFKLGSTSISGDNGVLGSNAVWCEQIVYNRVITAQERSDLNDFVTTKWG